MIGNLLRRGLALQIPRRAFAMGLKRPKLSDTFNFPKHTDYLNEDYYYQEGD